MSVNLFDVNFYRAANADLRTFSDAQALSHFQTYGLNEGRAFSPFANLNFYRSSNPDLAAAGLNTNRQLLNHLQNYGVAEGRRFSPFIDINDYLNSQVDVAQAYGGNKERGLEHLRNYGIAEGRPFSPFVNLDYYLSTYSDLNQAFAGDRNLAFRHLQTNGLAEGRKFTLDFDVNFYRSIYPDLANAGLRTNDLAFQHWVSYGYDEGRVGIPEPGNFTGTALDLGAINSFLTANNSVVTLKGKVGGADSSDFYKFTLSQTSAVFAQLSAQTGDGDIQLLDSSTSTIVSSIASNNLGDAVIAVLNPGTYYTRVYGASDHTFQLGAIKLPGTDLGGNDFISAFDIGEANLPERIVIRESVSSSSDLSDYYEFTLDRNTNFSATLSDLSADADLYLFNFNRSSIRSSTNSSNIPDNITTNLPAGTYFVRVQAIGSTNYNLQLEVS